MESKDSDGNIRKCRGCRSIWRFIRDCDKVKQASVVNLVFELPTLADVQSLSTYQILDTIQDLPANVWFSVSEQLVADEISSSDVAEAAYTRLAMLADLHEILKTRPAHQLASPPTTVKSAFVTESTDMCSMNIIAIKKIH